MIISKLIEKNNEYVVNDNTIVPKNSNGSMKDEVLEYIKNGGEYQKVSEKDKTTETFIPEKVTIRQAKLALLDFGLLDGVDAILNSPNVPRKTKIEWEYANEIERRWVDESGLMSYLGVEKEQIDELFLYASSL